MNKSPPHTINLDSFNDDEAAEPDPRSAPGQDVVDLTSDLGGVVDLTNDTVLVVDEDQAPSYVVSSDEEDTASEMTATSTPSAGKQRSSGVHINCPVCMDSYHEIVDSGRLLVSTRCGHVFCSLCLRDSLNHSSCCPICRKKLPKGHYHYIYNHL